MHFITQKKCCVVFLLLFTSRLILSQSQSFDTKDIFVSASIGLTHLAKNSYKQTTKSDAFLTSFRGNAEVKSIKGVNPFALKYEYALSPDFGIGICVAWWNVHINVDDHYSLGNGSQEIDSYDFKISSVAFGIRPNYHFLLKSKTIDLFLGCGLGLSKNDLTVTMSSTQNTGIFKSVFQDFKLPSALYFAPTFGLRFFLAKNVGVNIEMGYDQGALAQAGLFFRFRPIRFEFPNK